MESGGKGGHENKRGSIRDVGGIRVKGEKNNIGNE
jgi:hypothetical protein